MALTRLVRRAIRGRATGRGYWSTAVASTVAAATWVRSSMARSALVATPSGSVPRSKRALDSERSFRRFELRAMPIGSK